MTAGFHAGAPGMRGYGQTDARQKSNATRCSTWSFDMMGLVDALGIAHAVIVGHDCGARWRGMQQLRPDRFRAVSELRQDSSG
jgi:pimeloyl-ACP methyl ester carboxylesterase